jgi:hypothetical protein
MDVRDWAAGAEIVRTALRALLAKRGSGEKVSALIDRNTQHFSAFMSGGGCGSRPEEETA